MAYKKLNPVIAICCVTVGFAQQPAPPPPAAGYRLVFHDEFDKLDLARTAAESRTWSEGVWFSKNHAPLTNITVANSQLKLTWLPSQSQPDTTITTLAKDRRHFLAWRYGYFEARMKWDVVTGAWPAFWLIPIEDATGEDFYAGTKESGEIDVFEGIGSDPRTFYGTIHDWIGGKDHASKPNYFRIPSDQNFSDFHLYGLLWEPGKVTWFFDNQPLHTEPTGPIFDKQNFFIVLGMQEGVNWKEGDRRGVSAQEMALSVDWVRVWQTTK